MVYAVIGANYGDEGKGLVTDILTRQGNQKVVIRHNGGAQSGHTVEKESGERFVFHELSSGSFNGAITYWANTFYPDLYKLEEEIKEFNKVCDTPVKIYASENTNITLIFDVIIQGIQKEVQAILVHGLIKLLPPVLLPANQGFQPAVTQAECIVQYGFIVVNLLERKARHIADSSLFLSFNNARGKVIIAEFQTGESPAAIQAQHPRCRPFPKAGIGYPAIGLVAVCMGVLVGEAGIPDKPLMVAGCIQGIVYETIVALIFR